VNGKACPQWAGFFYIRNGTNLLLRFKTQRILKPKWVIGYKKPNNALPTEEAIKAVAFYIEESTP